MIDVASLGQETEQALGGLSTQELALLEWRMRWKSLGRAKQHPPEYEWDTWGLMTGRGFGKTLTGAHWEGISACMNPGTMGAVIAPTLDDVRYTNFEGPTGIITIAPPCLIIDYNKSDLIIYWWNGSITRGFGSEKPNRLRGPQHHRAWCDELGAWEYQEDTWDMMEFGLRLGELPRILWTTTPKPSPVVKRLVDACKADPSRNVLVVGSTDENRENLTRKFYERVARYRGTKIGRQELEGELIDPEESGIVLRSQFRLWPAKKPLPFFLHVVYSLDTAYTAKTFDPKKKEPDPSGYLVLGLFELRGLLNVMILDCGQGWWAFPELVLKVKEDMKITYGEVDRPVLQQSLIPSKWTGNPVSTGRGIDVLLIEDKGSGISLRQTLSMENIFMEPFNPGRADKLARLHAVTPMLAHGRVWLVESDKNPGKPKTWYEQDCMHDPNLPCNEAPEGSHYPGFIPVVCTFHGEGTVAHDEYVDTLSQGLRYFMHKFIFTFVTGESEEERLAIQQEEERFQQEQAAYKWDNPYAA